MHRLHSFPIHPHFYVFCETDTFDMTYLFNSSLQMPRMCVSEMGQHRLGNGLAPVGRQVIPSTNADLLLIGPSYQIKKQERRLKRRNTLGGLEISTRHQIVNTLELSSPPKCSDNLVLFIYSFTYPYKTYCNQILYGVSRRLRISIKYLYYRRKSYV